MREKSKFIAFILSFVPGLSHFYLGFADRGLIFLIVFLGALAGTMGFAFIISGEIAIILIFVLPLIWLVALLDAFSLVRGFKLSDHTGRQEYMERESDGGIREFNRKTITMALSIIPGAGHMYLGFDKKGIILMGAFFFTIFFMGWLGLSLLLFILPLIWFYSFFDALHTVKGKRVEEDEFIDILPNIKPQWLGWGLIAIGVFIAMERILYPMIPYEIRNYIQTSIISIIFIIGGIKLLNRGDKKEKREEAEDICKKDE